MKPPVDASYQLLAARYIRRQIKQLTGQIEGIHKAEDIEHVHRARVASRRLRSALAIFEDCFPEDRVRYWRKEIRRLGRGLGDARDRDVQIDFVGDLLARLQDRACMPGAARVLVSCQRKREKLQPEVLRLLERLLAGRALHQMLSATKKLTAVAQNELLTEKSPLVFQRAEQHITERLGELRAFEPCLARPDAFEQHHAMRIAAKRLRYTMEVFRPIYDGALDRPVEAVKQVQSFLGDVHDCDVWVEQLDRMLVKQSRRLQRLFRHTAPLARLQAGIEHLKQDRRRRRRDLFDTLVQFWQEQSEAGLWTELLQVVQARGQPAAEPNHRLTIHWPDDASPAKGGPGDAGALPSPKSAALGPAGETCRAAPEALEVG